MIHRFPVFLSILIFLLLGLLVGCSERIGPSDEKVALDFKEHIKKQFQTVVQVQSFSVDNVHQLSEDKVDIDVTVNLQIDLSVEEKINNYRDPFGGYSSHPLKRFWRNAQRLNLGQDEYLTLHYYLNENGLWIGRGFSVRQK